MNTRTGLSPLISVSILFIFLALLLSAYLNYKSFASLLNKQDIMLSNQKVVHDKFSNGASQTFPNNPRVLGMAATLASDGIGINKITKYVHLIAPIVRDESARYEFLTAVGAMGNRSLIVKRIADRKLKIFDEWDVEFDNNEAFMLNNFPVAPFLAMNLEILPYPNCEAGKKPTLLYVKATKNGEVWASEPDIISDDDSARWVIRFKDITEFDKRSLNRRVVVSTSCV